MWRLVASTVLVGATRNTADITGQEADKSRGSVCDCLSVKTWRLVAAAAVDDATRNKADMSGTGYEQSEPMDLRFAGFADQWIQTAVRVRVARPHFIVTLRPFADCTVDRLAGRHDPCSAMTDTPSKRS
jgi:hypothetical protein